MSEDTQWAFRLPHGTYGRGVLKGTNDGGSAAERWNCNINV